MRDSEPAENTAQKQRERPSHRATSDTPKAGPKRARNWLRYFHRDQPDHLVRDPSLPHCRVSRIKHTNTSIPLSNKNRRVLPLTINI
jgi:hypothetical protein